MARQRHGDSRGRLGDCIFATTKALDSAREELRTLRAKWAHSHRHVVDKMTFSPLVYVDQISDEGFAMPVTISTDDSKSGLRASELPNPSELPNQSELPNSRTSELPNLPNVPGLCPTIPGR